MIQKDQQKKKYTYLQHGLHIYLFYFDSFICTYFITLQGERLFDANRQVLYEQTCDDIDTWITDLEKQIDQGDTGMDLASVNILMQKQQVI